MNPSPKLKVYYAHCKVIYYTPQERRDIDTLKALGFDVINPSEPWVDKALEVIPPDERMAWFEQFADECDAIAFRGLPMSDKIPSGVLKEIAWFTKRSKPVIELPSMSSARAVSLEDTRAYLREVGQR